MPTDYGDGDCLESSVERNMLKNYCFISCAVSKRQHSWWVDCISCRLSVVVCQPLLKYCFFSLKLGLLLMKLCMSDKMAAGYKQGDHVSGKPGNVREFDSCQGNSTDFTKCQGSVGGKILSGKSGLKLFIVSCIFVSIQVFSRSLFCVIYKIYDFGSCTVAFLPPPLVRGWYE